MSAKSGCGCGGGGGSTSVGVGVMSSGMSTSAGTRTAGGCGCGGSGGGGSCAVPAGAGAAMGALVRPKFFAGQLLTEDDLQQLVTYVVDKHRLQNRYLFGDGVACGLEVSCDPCEPGRVTVAPGYAIDCCGNDIVVSCPSSVDVLAMVRELRTRLRGGFDCGDPCEEEPEPKKRKPIAKPEVPATPDAAMVARMAMVASPAAPARAVPAPAPPARTQRDRVYCLYIRYADEETEPVAPYTTDEACAGTTCEPTRVREGYRFELRCRDAGAAPSDVLSHMLCCIGDFINAESSFAAARAVQQQARRLEDAHQVLDLYEKDHEPISRGDTYQAELTRRIDALEPYLSSQTRREGDPDGAFEAFTELATWAARWYLHTQTQRFALETHASTLPQTLTQAHAKLTEAVPKLEADALKELDTSVDRRIAQETMTLARLWVPAPTTPAPADTATPSYEAALFAAGAPHSLALHRELLDALADLRRDLLDRVGEAPRTHCDLLREIDALLLPSPSGAGELHRSDVESFLRAVERLTASLLRYFQDCFCAALNPQCTPCDDPAVLLACLRVDGCDVIDICNLGRRWVLSAANLRYWLGPLRIVSRLLEWACCEPIRAPRRPPPRDRQADPVPDNTDDEGFASFASRAQPYGAGGSRMRLADVLSGPDFASKDLPDLLISELASIYLPGGNPELQFRDFARVAEQLGRMISARYGGDSRKRAHAAVRKQDGEILAILESEPVKKRVERIAFDAVARGVEEKKLDLSSAVERSAEVTLTKLRAERGEAVRAQLEGWAASDEGLSKSLRPAILAAVEQQLPVIEHRQREELERVVRNSGLDTSSMTQRIGASVDAKVAALGLNRESLDSRISSTLQGALAANGLVAEALGRRLDDAVRSRLDTEGLEREAFDRRLSLSVRNALASEGFTATALGERIHAEVAGSFAREGLTGKTLEERVDGRIRAGIQPLLESELKRYAAGSQAAALERVDTLTRELEGLRADYTALVKKLGDPPGNGGGAAGGGRRRKKED